MSALSSFVRSGATDNPRTAEFVIVIDLVGPETPALFTAATENKICAFVVNMLFVGS